MCSLTVHVQVLENADRRFVVGSGHWVTVTGRSNKEDYDLAVAGLLLPVPLMNITTFSLCLKSLLLKDLLQFEPSTAKENLWG